MPCIRRPGQYLDLLARACSARGFDILPCCVEPCPASPCGSLGDMLFMCADDWLPRGSTHCLAFYLDAGHWGGTGRHRNGSHPLGIPGLSPAVWNHLDAANWFLLKTLRNMRRASLVGVPYFCVMPRWLARAEDPHLKEMFRFI